MTIETNFNKCMVGGLVSNFLEKIEGHIIKLVGLDFKRAYTVYKNHVHVNLDVQYLLQPRVFSSKEQAPYTKHAYIMYVYTAYCKLN